MYRFFPIVLGKYGKTANQFFGILPGVASAFVLLSFLLTVIISLPLSPFVKNAIFSAKIGNMIVAKTQMFEKNLNDIFGESR